MMMSLLAASCTPDNKDGAIDSAQTLKGERVAVSVNVQAGQERFCLSPQKEK